MIREVQASPAFDRTDKGQGVHCVDLKFIVRGECGCVIFTLYTGWNLPHVQDKLEESIEERWSQVQVSRERKYLFSPMRPMPADIGYHSSVPMYEGHLPRYDCPYINGPCHYDGSSMNAQKYYDMLVEKGTDALWPALEDYYEHVFGERI